MELVQGLFRSSRISPIPAVVPSVPQPFPYSGQQTESVAAEPRYRGGGARFSIGPCIWANGPVDGTLEQWKLVNPEEIGFSDPVPKKNFRRMVGFNIPIHLSG